MSPEPRAHSSDPEAATDTDRSQDERRTVAATRLSLHMKKLHRHIASHVMSAMQDQMQDEDLSFSQMSALHQLRAYAPMSVSRLAERTGLSLPAASHLTDRMVVRGYAQRRENPDDRRAKLLDLSERGQQILDEMDRRFTDAYRVAFMRVSPEAVAFAADSVELLLNELLANDLLNAEAPAQPICAPTSAGPSLSAPSRPPSRTVSPNSAVSGPQSASPQSSAPAPATEENV